MSNEFGAADQTGQPQEAADASQTRELRKRTFKAGIASYQNHALTTNCTVRDFNDGGAKLRFEENAFVPENFTLTVPIDGIRVDCQVKWRRGEEMGVVFMSEIDQDPRMLRKQSLDLKYLMPRKSSLRKRPG